MPHLRQVLRDYLRTRLNNQTSAGANVFAARILPNLDQAKSITIYTPSEKQTGWYSIAPRIPEITIDVMILVEVLAAPDTLLNTLDDLCLEVENKVPTLLPQNDFFTLDYQGTEIALEDTLQKPVAMATIRYSATFVWTRLTGDASEEPLNDFLGATFGWDLAPPDGRLEAQDDYNIPQ